MFTGCEDEENRTENPHGGAMWARMPITALVEDDVGNLSILNWPEEREKLKLISFEEKKKLKEDAA